MITLFQLILRANDVLNLRGRYNYENIRRWSKKVPGKDIFKLKNMFPIHLDNLHWMLAVIFMEEKIIQYYDSYTYDMDAGCLLKLFVASTMTPQHHLLSPTPQLSNNSPPPAPV
jgi:hypothetical protein